MMSPKNLAIGLLIFGLIQTFSATVNAQSKADEIRAIERERLRSLVEADMATARRLHADGFQLIDPRGGTHSKEQYLKSIESGDLNYLEWNPEEIRVRMYGNSAVIRYQAHLRVSVRGSAGRPVTFWHTDLYEKRKGQWQIVWSHATQLDQRAGEADESAIRALATHWEQAWNRHDAKALAKLMTDDGDLVSAGAKHFKGREQIEAEHAARLNHFRGSTSTSKVASIQFLKPDLALVRVDWVLNGGKDADGTPQHLSAGVLTWIAVKQGTQWSIRSSQNTLARSERGKAED